MIKNIFICNILIIFALGTAGCSNNDAFAFGKGIVATAPIQEANSYTVTFFPQTPPYKDEGPRSYPAALIEGEVTVANGCLRIVDSFKNSLLLIWPPTFSYKADRTGVTVFNSKGEVFARTGEQSKIGGGEITLASVKPYLPPSLLENCRGSYWLVSPS